jgi:hypothetical protein
MDEEHPATSEHWAGFDGIQHHAVQRRILGIRHARSFTVTTDSGSGGVAMTIRLKYLGHCGLDVLEGAQASLPESPKQKL